MNKKQLTILAAMLSLALHAYSRNDDFGIWTEVNLKKKIAMGLEASASGEYRSCHNTGQTDRWSASAGMTYKPWKFLKAGAEYVYLHNRQAAETTSKGNDIPAYWSPRHRVSLAFTGTVTWGRLAFSLRERYQITRRKALSVPQYDAEGSPEEEKRISAKTKQLLRSRLQVEYVLSHCRLTPYLSCERFNALREALATEKTRWTIGSRYKLNQRHTLDVCYRYQDESDRDDTDRHVLGIGYTFKL